MIAPTALEMQEPEMSVQDAARFAAQSMRARIGDALPMNGAQEYELRVIAVLERLAKAAQVWVMP